MKGTGIMMEINEMILVIEKQRGEEMNALMTTPDYIKFAPVEKEALPLEVAERMVALGRTVGTEMEWIEYKTAEKSISTKYCKEEQQLIKFLQGGYNSTNQSWTFDSERSSSLCMEKLMAVGIDTKGRRKYSGFHYELQEAAFEQGEILHNFNGSDYRVMETLSPKNLLLMEEVTGNFIVAIGVEFYKRTHKGEGASEINYTYGMEWGHGIYLSSTPSTIDFHYIRQEYGTTERVEGLSGYRNRLERKFKQYQKLVKDDLLSDTIKKAVGTSMYEEFGTKKAEVFMDKLEEGRYDHGFTGNRVPKKGRAR
ncbi:hypothetical protein [Anaerocolumna cellulosilytica]|nr:hypothetical protein [Anaerocolumna cellulosilytica]MBB5196293.1 hypothetical protein [Anaerocolumna cellulosilytica]